MSFKYKMSYEENTSVLYEKVRHFPFRFAYE